MRKLRNTRKHYEEIRKQRAIDRELRENGMSEADIANFKNMMQVTDIIEATANEAVAKRLRKLGINSSNEEEKTTVKEEEVETTDVQGQSN